MKHFNLLSQCHMPGHIVPAPECLTDENITRFPSDYQGRPYAKQGAYIAAAGADTEAGADAEAGG